MANNKTLPNISGNETIASSWDRLLTRDRNISTLFAGDNFTSDQISTDIGRPNWRTDLHELFIWNGERFISFFDYMDLNKIAFETDNPDIPESIQTLKAILDVLINRNLSNTITLPAEGVHYTADGLTNTYSLPRYTNNKYSLFVFIDGVKQESTTYDLTSDGLGITFKVIPNRSEKIEIIQHASLTEWDYSPNIEHFTGDGTTKVFNLSFEVLRPEVLSVNVDGIELQKNQFSVTDIRQITLETAPSNNAKIQIMGLGKTTLVTVSPNSINTENLQNKCVTAEKLADGIIFTIDSIPANSIESVKLTNSSVTSAKLANNAVSTAKIVNKAVTEAKLETAVQNKLLAIQRVDTQHIKDHAVTPDKLAESLMKRITDLEEAVAELQGGQ